MATHITVEEILEINLTYLIGLTIIVVHSLAAVKDSLIRVFKKYEIEITPVFVNAMTIIGMGTDYCSKRTFYFCLFSFLEN